MSDARGMKNPFYRTYIIAEMACSHEGDVKLAKKIIDGAGSSGADAIQFQIWQAELIMVPHHKDYPLLLSVQLTQDQWTELFHYSKSKYPDMDVIACIYETTSMNFAYSLGVDAFKIHTADLANSSLIRECAKLGIRIDLSVGGSTLDEITNAVSWIQDEGDSEIWMMYGMQNFPTPPEDINLQYLNSLKQLYGLQVGYQDHSAGGSEAGYYLPAAAVGMGINIQEKHITHDRSFEGVDHHAALNPDEFQKFVYMIRELDLAMGNPHPKTLTESEMVYRNYAKKSLVVSRDMKKGDTISANDLLFLRSEDMGTPLDQADLFIGKTLEKDITAHTTLKLKDVK